jgi:hypothetical protein
MRTEKKVREVTVRLPKAHFMQQAFISSKAKRKVIRAGRRGGKTVGVAILAVYAFLAGRRVLYAAPTIEQVARFWTEVTRAMAEPIAAGALRKNETEHLIERRGTEARIRAKTAWNSDSLRGDYADLLILDEWQLMDEAAWEEVGAPMLLDNNGDAVFIYTPPSLRSRSVSKAHDPQHAAKLFKKAQALSSGDRWVTFTFSSFDNPHISREALDDIIQDMTAVAYRQEIMAEDVDEAPGAMWTRDILEASRVTATPPDVVRRVVGLDPSTTSSGDDAGIITVAQCGDDLYVEADNSLQGSPAEWARAACTAASEMDADGIVAEKNQGGEMVSLTIATIDQKIPVWLVHASRGKEPRSQPVASATRQGKVHMVGQHPALEDELCLWVPGDRKSPGRLDAFVWACAWLMGIADGQQSDVEMLEDCVV